jgi:hypothetical protein
MRDTVDDKQFNFAIEVNAANQTSAENRAQYGYTEADGARWEAGRKALEEFPSAVLMDVKLIEPSLVELNNRRLMQLL